MIIGRMVNATVLIVVMVLRGMGSMIIIAIYEM